MKVIGIVAEYNPFHNGHLYQIKKIKESYPNSLIIAIISSSFSQRGEAIILDKWERTEIILKYEVDLVIELPYPFSTQSADNFAYGSIGILNSLKIDILSFGIETSIDDLISAAKVQIKNKDFDKKVKEYLGQKYNYRTSVSKSIYDLTKINISSPNDTLSVSYIKEILKENMNIELLPIKRTNDYLDLTSNDKIVSASNIRNKISINKSIKKYVPKYSYSFLKDIKINEEVYFSLLKYKILSANDLNKYVTVDEGIDNRIKSCIFNSHNINELINNVKSKRYTENKIRRTLCHILNDFTKSDKELLNTIEYIRVLGFNSKGKNYLNSIKKDINLPILTNYKKGYKMLEFEIKVSTIYDMIMNKNTRELEYKKKPIIL